MNRSIKLWTILSCCLAACAANDGEPEESGDAIRTGALSQALLGDLAVGFRNVNSNRCIGVDGASRAAGAFIKQFTCDGSANQTWITSESNDNLVNSNSNLCMGVDNGSPSPGANIRQFACDGRANQLWAARPFSDGSISLVNADTLCIGVDGASLDNGAQLQQFECDGRANQRWFFE